MSLGGEAMEEGKRFTKNILIVTISNIIRLVAGMAIGLVIPKFLSIEDYGYYKTYTLYMTYIGLFSLGLIDGIYLKYGGMDYNELDRNKFRCYIKALFYLQLIISVIIFVVSFFFFKGESKIIFISIAVNLTAQQLLTYFASVSQLSSQFNILSIFNIFWSILTLIGVGLIYIIPNANYFIYIIIVVSTNYILLLYYFIKYKEIIFGKSNSIRSEKDEIISLIKLGLPLLIANLVSTLILSCDRIFVERLYDTNIYAFYSFAYSLFSIANTFITAVSMVLYPMLKKMNGDKVKDNYNKAIALMLMVVFGGLALYFPLDAFIRWYLEKYIDSLLIFKIILPGLAVSSCITVVMQNYYKVANKNLSFFIKSLIVLVCAIILNILAIVLLKEPMYISIASVISLFLWYFLSEFFFVKEYKANPIKNISFLFILTLAFYLTSFLLNVWLGFIVYIFVLIILMFAFYHEIILKILNSIIKRNDN